MNLGFCCLVNFFHGSLCWVLEILCCLIKKIWRQKFREYRVTMKKQVWGKTVTFSSAGCWDWLPPIQLRWVIGSTGGSSYVQYGYCFVLVCHHSSYGKRSVSTISNPMEGELSRILVMMMNGGQFSNKSTHFGCLLLE